MKLAFNTWVYSSFPVWVPSYPLEVAVPRLAAIGYDGIEIGAAAPARLSRTTPAPERRREIRKLLETNRHRARQHAAGAGRRTGLQRRPRRSQEERAAAIDQYKKVVELCAELGRQDRPLRRGLADLRHDARGGLGVEPRRARRDRQTAADTASPCAVEPTSADSNLVDSCDDAIALMKARSESPTSR